MLLVFGTTKRITHGRAASFPAIPEKDPYVEACLQHERLWCCIPKTHMALLKQLDSKLGYFSLFLRIYHSRNLLLENLFGNYVDPIGWNGYVDPIIVPTPA